MMYDTSEEAKQKLANSVVFYKGGPVWVRDAYMKSGDVVLMYLPLPLGKASKEKIILGEGETVKKNMAEAPISDGNWDFRTIGSRLGYVTIKGLDDRYTTAFCSRIPTRHSRQGLDNRTVKVNAETGASFENLIYEEPIVNTMRGVFKSFKEAFTDLVTKPDTYRSIAVNRKMQLSWDKVTPPVLWYREDRVGYTEDGELFKLAPHKKFLQEELQDMEGLKIA